MGRPGSTTRRWGWVVAVGWTLLGLWTLASGATLLGAGQLVLGAVALLALDSPRVDRLVHGPVLRRRERPDQVSAPGRG